MQEISKEQSFITEIILSGDFLTVTENHIEPNYFRGQDKKVFKFIQDHVVKYGKTPSLTTFTKKFPEYELMENNDGNVYTGETLKYWIDEVRNKKKSNTLIVGLEKAIEEISELDNNSTEQAYMIIKDTINVIETKVEVSVRHRLNRDTETRKADYLARQTSGGLIGIPTGISDWDLMNGGSKKGELTTIQGYTGLGKTWLLLIQAVYQAKLGYRVQFFTTEMSPDMIIRRVEALWNDLNYTRFLEGKLLPDEERRYFNYLEEMSNLEDDDIPLVIEKADAGVTQISTKIDDFKPDIVYIDGAYLLEDEKMGDDEHAGITRIWRALHRMCLSKNIPLIVSSQNKEDEGVSLKSTSFAKATNHESDVVLALEQDSQMKNDKEIKVKPLKVREGKTNQYIVLNWDFDSMKYGSIYTKELEQADESVEVEGVLNFG